MESGFTPGWAIAIQGAIYIIGQVISYFKSRSKAKQDRDKVINETASPIQVVNVADDVHIVKVKQSEQDKRLADMEAQLAAVATKKDLATAIQHSELGLQDKVRSAVTDSLTGFAKGKAMSEKTVIEADKKPEP